MTYKKLENILNNTLDIVASNDEYEKKVQMYINKGATRSDAQAIVDLELLNNNK